MLSDKPSESKADLGKPRLRNEREMSMETDLSESTAAGENSTNGGEEGEMLQNREEEMAEIRAGERESSKKWVYCWCTWVAFDKE